MTRQNRVLPTGQIVDRPFRGAFTGNRGVLHDAAGRIRRPWQVRRWLCCVLDFKGRRREIMTPGRWTELFFFDEAVALAAGHRPCAECRRADFERFRTAWVAANGGPQPSATTMDDALHAARVTGDREKRTFRAEAVALPDGVFVRGASGEAALLRGGRIHPYRFDHYGDPHPVPSEVEVLTPAPTVAAIAAGYVPEIRLP